MYRDIHIFPLKLLIQQTEHRGLLGARNEVLRFEDVVLVFLILILRIEIGTIEIKEAVREFVAGDGLDAQVHALVLLEVQGFEALCETGAGFHEVAAAFFVFFVVELDMSTQFLHLFRSFIDNITHFKQFFFVLQQNLIGFFLFASKTSSRTAFIEILLISRGWQGGILLPKPIFCSKRT